MLAALALADYNVLDEWRKKMGATCEETNCAPQCRQKCIEMGME